ncbi:response regulator transcription factor [Neobacillus drentensis]|uniref:response regulator transcription factor n=1 Tax=Neobacillus drentensis TaxID=220684 RepID=UPI002FFD7151
MQSKILIVEDETILREIAKDYLIKEKYEVYEATDGEQALALFEEYLFDLIILDIMLPAVDGWSVCRRIRKMSNVPVILLTARSDEEDTLLGFELGTDDYVTKPFKPNILLARAKRLFKNSIRPSHQQDSIDLCGIYVDKLARTVVVEGTKIDFTHTEYEILVCLMEHKEQVLTRETLITHIWGYDYGGDDKTLTAHMRNVRLKLGEKGKHITTVIRTGYKFEVNQK